MKNNPIIVALDGMTKEEALSLSKKLKGKVWGFKVNDLLAEHGVKIIYELKEYGGVFADPKLYDIPNTMVNSVRKLVASGADIITVHGSAGREALKAVSQEKKGSLICAVTALTSFSDQVLSEIYSVDAKTLVQKIAHIAVEVGIPGIICSPEELTLVKGSTFTSQLSCVVPGVRPVGSSKDDQSRTATPEETMKRGAQFLVIGRPITQAHDPVRASEEIFESLNRG